MCHLLYKGASRAAGDFLFLKHNMNTIKHISVGLTEITDAPAYLIITHCGNSGDTFTRSVDPNLKHAGFKSVAELRKLRPVLKEEGSPDYAWSIKFDKTKRL